MEEVEYKIPPESRKWVLLGRIKGYEVKDKKLIIQGEKIPYIKPYEIMEIPFPEDVKGVKRVRTEFGDIARGIIRVTWEKKMEKVV